MFPGHREQAGTGYLCPPTFPQVKRTFYLCPNPPAQVKSGTCALFPPP